MHPVLFTLPGLEWQVQAYGFLIGVALVAGWIVALRLARHDRLPSELLGTNYVLSAAFALFGARAVWLVQHPQAIDGWASLVALQAGGLAPFAGIVLGALTTGALAALRRIPVSAWYDCLALPFAIGVVLERLGAFLAGTGHGRYAPDFPLAMRFPAGSLVFEQHRRELGALLRSTAAESLPVHPVQLYGMILALGAVALAWWLRKHRRFSGQVFLGTASFYLAMRAFVEEPLRADAVPGVVGPLNAGQVLAIAVISAMAIVYRVRSRQAATAPERVQLWLGGPWSPQTEAAPVEPSPKPASKQPSPKKTDRPKRPRRTGR